MDNKLFVKKYRPKTINEIILLPRIKSLFLDGNVNQNYIFYGHYGTGKTSLARILIGKYSKDRAFLEINASKETSIDVLRNEIETFCSTVPMGLDLNSNYDSTFKYVFLDEYEKASPAAQEAFKAFVEKYEDRVRFILTTNNLNKVNGGVRSRFTEVDFDVRSMEEKRYLMNEIYKVIVNDILPKEEIEMNKEDVKNLILKKFPDFRSIIRLIQHYKYTSDINGAKIINIELQNKLYHLLSDDSLSYDNIYHFLMDNFGPTGISDMINILGVPYITWFSENGSDMEKMFDINHIVTKYTQLLDTSTDPIVLGMTIIGDIRKILINK